ncbi:unnamed protein product [Miscanthus lutarioriparius]|uniref:Uncharacterized protein n=1 Tax=Miscanthus lutarioriparius TaxID=422564 RepID=A0A811SJT4_9POAL|nr:unnamed protein product [Miscanthus lutarioriparius]
MAPSVARMRAAVAAAAAARMTGRACGRGRSLSSASAGDASRAESEGGESESEEANNLVKKATADSKELKLVLLEKDLADLKSSFEYQSKVNWWAMGLVETLFASLPVALQTVNSVDEKQKRLEEKYKGLKSRLVRMEHANKTDENEKKTEEAEEKEEKEDEKTEKEEKSWGSWILSPSVQSLIARFPKLLDHVGLNLAAACSSSQNQQSTAALDFYYFISSFTEESNDDGTPRLLSSTGSSRPHGACIRRIRGGSKIGSPTVGAAAL